MKRGMFQRSQPGYVWKPIIEQLLAVVLVLAFTLTVKGILLMFNSLNYFATIGR